MCAEPYPDGKKEDIGTTSGLYSILPPPPSGSEDCTSARAYLKSVSAPKALPKDLFRLTGTAPAVAALISSSDSVARMRNKRDTEPGGLVDNSSGAAIQKELRAKLARLRGE